MSITITGTQVQFPGNGNMEGFYTGGSATATSLPIGSYLGASSFTGAPTPAVNTSAVVYAYNSCGYSFYTLGSGSTMSGTWVNRGLTTSSIGYGCCGPFASYGVLMQRIA